MSVQISASQLLKRLTGNTLRILVIQARFPYHKYPLLYKWLWVFIMLPFFEEDSLNDLSEKHGKPLRKLYGLLRRHPETFEKFVHLFSLPLFFELLKDFHVANATSRSRQRLKLIVDDTKAEKFGKCMEFLHKLYDHTKDDYIMGYNYVLVLVVSGTIVFPLSFILWLPKESPNYRSKNDIIRDEINALHTICKNRGQELTEVEFLGDSAYCVQKVLAAADKAGLRIITKPGNNHKFEFEGESLTPKEIIEKVKKRQWKYLEANTWYQRVSAKHHVYGDVVLVVRSRQLKNEKVVYDILLCNKTFYNGVRIHKSYKRRWEIELHFKYYKQYLSLGKAQFGKLGSIRSQLACVAIAALMVALFRRQAFRKMSFRQAVKLMTQELRGG